MDFFSPFFRMSQCIYISDVTISITYANNMCILCMDTHEQILKVRIVDHLFLQVPNQIQV